MQHPEQNQSQQGASTLNTSTMQRQQDDLNKRESEVMRKKIEDYNALQQSTMEHLVSMGIDGLTNIVRSKYTSLKLIWLVIFVISAGACAVLVVQTIQEFFEFKVRTTIRYQTEDSTLYPSVLFCSANPFTTTASVAFLNQTGSVDYADTPYNNLMLLQKYMKTTTGSYLSHSTLQALGPIDNILASCTFKGASCSSSDFVPIFHPKYLNCFMFNSPWDSSGNAQTLKTVSYPGELNMFVIMFKLI